MPHTYSITETRDKITREPLWFIVRDGKAVDMKFSSPQLVHEFLTILKEDDEKKYVGAKRSAA